MPVIKNVTQEDDFRPAYEGAYNAQRRADNEAWMQNLVGGGGAGGAPADGGETVLPTINVTPDDAPLPEGNDYSPSPYAGMQDEEGASLMDYAGAALSGAWGMTKDVTRGLTEAVPQAFGGLVDAIGEVDQFMQELVPIGGARLFDEEGNFSPGIVTGEEMKRDREAGETLFNMLATDEASSVTGGIIRSASQFLAGFIPGMQASRAMGLGKIAAGFAAGAIADAVVFDPHEARLSTFLNEVPALEPLVWDYLADHDPENQSAWEGRLKNAIEGAGIGAAAEGMLYAFKYYKAQRAGRPKPEQNDPRAIAEQDAKKALAEAEISNDITEEMLRPLGDASENAPLVIEAAPDETLSTALARLAEADTRAAKMAEQGGALAKVQEIIEGKKRNIDQDAAYQGGADGHKAPRAENGARPISDVSGAWPDDFYSREGLSIYGDGSPHDAKAKKIIDGLRGKPDAEITIYRAVPNDADGAINAGDWVSLTREYAVDHGDGALGSDFRIVSKKVKASDVLTDGNSIHEWGYSPKGKPNSRVPTGETSREAIDDALDELRSGAVSKAKFKARPVAAIVRELGGVDPTSSLAGDLRSRGITAKSFPGLFRKRGGLQSLDNIPGSEHAIFTERNLVSADGYVSEQAFIDGLEAELRGEPWRLADEQRAIDEIVAPAQELDEQLSRLGIGYENMSNDAVKARLKELYDEQASWDAYQEAAEARINRDNAPRTYADLVDEQREIWSVDQTAEARAAGVDEAIIAQHQPPKVYINMARIKGAEDVKSIIQAVADADEAAIKDRTRGVVSNAQTIKESSREYKDLSDLIGRPPGPMSAAQAVAARKVLASSAEQLTQLAKIASEPNAGNVDIYNFRRALSVHAAIQAEVIGARTETARALQSWSIPVGSDRIRTDAVNDLMATYQGGDLQRLAKAMSNVNSEAAINQMARDTLSIRAADALYSVYVNGLLSGPKTHLVNAMSNAAVAMYAIPERYVAEAFSHAFGNGDIARGEAASMAYGMLEGMRDGVRLMVAGPKAAGMDDLAELWGMFGRQEARPDAISAAAFNADPSSVMGRGLDTMGKVISIPGTFLEKGDLFFKSINYRMELHAQAHREASMLGLEGKEFAEKVADILMNPPANIVDEANKMALVNTFTNPLGETGRSIQNNIRKTGLRWFMPFVRTPTNIMKYSFSRTPLAYVSSSIRADIAAGGARAAQAHARVAMGTMLMATFAGAAMDGNITGGGPLDPKLNAAWRAAGNQPYSVKIGDRWFAVNRLDPLGMMVGMAADLAEIANSDAPDDENREMVFAAGISAFAQNMLSKTYAQGAFELAAAFDPRNPMGSPESLFTRQATGLIPFSALLRQTARFTDPVLRETRDDVLTEAGDKNEMASFLNRLVNNSKRGIPGLSDDLPPVRDIFGEPMTLESGIGAAWDMIMPIQSKSAETDHVAKTILDNQVKISRPNRVADGIQLNAEQYDELQQIAGPMVRERLEAIISSPGFKNMSPGPDGMQAVIIKRTVQQVHKQARSMLLMRDPAFRDARGRKMLHNRNSLIGAQ